MKRDKDLKYARSLYIKKVVGNSKKIRRTVKKLSKELFLSEVTIWRDLQRPYD